MAAAGTIKPTHKAIVKYRAALAEYAAGDVEHEGALETAFSGLLADTARAHGWHLIPKLSVRIGGKLIIPDGTLRDEFKLHRGYWEAKDTDDDLDEEITKKAGKVYPLNNTIFEDTQQVVLFQKELFFQGYSVKVAATHGIVYTPQPIVDFMCTSVAEVLKTEFGKNVTRLRALVGLPVPDLGKSANPLTTILQSAYKSFPLDRTVWCKDRIERANEIGGTMSKKDKTKLTTLIDLVKRVTEQKQREASAQEALKRARKSIQERGEFIPKVIKGHSVQIRL